MLVANSSDAHMCSICLAFSKDELILFLSYLTGALWCFDLHNSEIGVVICYGYYLHNVSTHSMCRVYVTACISAVLSHHNCT